MGKATWRAARKDSRCSADMFHLFEKQLDRPDPRDLAAKFSAHAIWVWTNSNSAQVQTIGVPARCNCWAVVVRAIGMPHAGVIQQVEFIIW